MKKYLTNRASRSPKGQSPVDFCCAGCSALKIQSCYRYKVSGRRSPGLAANRSQAKLRCTLTRCRQRGCQAKGEGYSRPGLLLSVRLSFDMIRVAVYGWYLDLTGSRGEAESELADCLLRTRLGVPDPMKHPHGTGLQQNLRRGSQYHVARSSQATSLADIGRTRQPEPGWRLRPN